jgi:hypothetical protein
MISKSDTYNLMSYERSVAISLEQVVCLAISDWLDEIAALRSYDILY